MHSFFSKLVMLGVVAGGFFVTGDLSGLLERGRAITERTAVPNSGASDSGFAAPLPPSPEASPSAGRPASAAPAASPPASPAATPAVDSENIARIPMPAMGLESLEFSSLPPGTRVLVLCGFHVVALDVVDGPGGEVLEHSHLVNPDRTVTIASTAAPRRLVVLGSTPSARDGWRLVGRASGRIARGEWLQLVPAGPPSPMPSTQALGPIERIGIE